MIWGGILQWCVGLDRLLELARLLPVSSFFGKEPCLHSLLYILIRVSLALKGRYWIKNERNIVRSAAFTFVVIHAVI